MRHARRVDANHASIRDGLRRFGYNVLDNSAVGFGIPDLAVLIFDGYSLHLEIKDPLQKDKRKHELTTAEKVWWDFNHSITRKVFTLEEALAAIRAYQAELSCRLAKT